MADPHDPNPPERARPSRARRRQARIEAELRGERFVDMPNPLSHRALLAGELGPRYERKLCVVLEPGTERFLGTAVAILLITRDGNEKSVRDTYNCEQAGETENTL